MEVISFAVHNSYSFDFAGSAARKRGFSLQEYIFQAQSSISEALNGLRQLRRLKLLVCALPVAICLSAVLIHASRLAENYAHPVPFSLSADIQADYLDKALFDHALDRSTYYDNEGNVIIDGSSTAATALADFVFKEPVTFQSYKVKAGDTIGSISQQFGLSNISTLIAINDIGNVRYLRSGQELQIPSLDGMMHTVTQGETLEGLSVKYSVTVEDLLDVNDMTSSLLVPGERIFIPGAKMDSTALQKAMGELFSWPITASWRLTSKFGSRTDPISGAASYHTGIDMACPTGTQIKAAMSGTVVYASWSNIFGNYVIIKHVDGYQTLYGHMSKILTKKGAFVSQGSVIGLVGSTGYSTGPHLHFTVYKNGKIINPMNVLK